MCVNRWQFCFLLVFAMKRCPIAAKIAGSIEILPCCVLNHLVWGYERLPDLGGFVATILCVRAPCIGVGKTVKTNIVMHNASRTKCL